MEPNQTVSDTMYSRIKRLLAPPVFKDEEKTRVAMILGIILWSVVAVVGILIITWLITGKSHELGPYAFAANTVIIVFAIGLLFLIRGGYLKTAGFTLDFGSGGLTVYLCQSFRRSDSRLYVR